MHLTISKMVIEAIAFGDVPLALGLNDLKALISAIMMNVSIAVIIKTELRKPPDKVDYFALHLKLRQGTAIITFGGTLPGLLVDLPERIQELKPFCSQNRMNISRHGRETCTQDFHNQPIKQRSPTNGIGRQQDWTTTPGLILRLAAYPPAHRCVTRQATQSAQLHQFVCLCPSQLQTPPSHAMPKPLPLKS